MSSFVFFDLSFKLSESLKRITFSCDPLVFGIRFGAKIICDFIPLSVKNDSGCLVLSCTSQTGGFSCNFIQTR